LGWRMTELGRAAMIAALDSTNRSLATWFAGVAQPELSNPSFTARWLRSALSHLMQTKTGGIFDFGGGNVSLRTVIDMAPTLAEDMIGAGVEPIACYCIGPSQDDLTSLGSLEEGGFRPRSAVLVPGPYAAFGTLVAVGAALRPCLPVMEALDIDFLDSASPQLFTIVMKTAHLNFFRGVAALWVLSYHCVIWSGAAASNPLPDAKLAVDVFMVLSGFLMAHTVTLHETAEPMERAANWVRFYARRFFRLAPVYYLALAGVFLIEPAFRDGYQALSLVSG
jgi:hypothetical protein